MEEVACSASLNMNEESEAGRAFVYVLLLASFVAGMLTSCNQFQESCSV